MACRRDVLAVTAALALLALLAPADPPLQPLDLDRGASGLALALRKVGVAARVLYVTAHPDDEMNGVLVRLSRGLGVRTALLTVTRGEGGQNAIGPELFDALGVLRTGELMAIHRHDGAEQYFGRANEFGFSFSVEETLAKWGREETLGDIVRVVRSFRPDVILTLPLEGEGGGQHHQAVGRLAREAFRVAADPARFPEQLREGLRPWQARKIYQGGVGGYGAIPGQPVRVPTGIYDPVLGMTWQQLGSRARSLHRCQGVGQIEADPGPADGVFSLLDAEPARGGPETDVLDGVDGSLAGLARFAPGSPGVASGLLAVQAQAARARASFDPALPEASAPSLADTLARLRDLAGSLAEGMASPAARAELAERLGEEEADIEAALALAQGLVLEARADDGLAIPGQSVGVAVALFNNAGRGLDVDSLELEVPAGWTVERRDGESGPVAGGGVRARASR
jgi:LmbE family N-acetylglucosaminyl deacetylase